MKISTFLLLFLRLTSAHVDFVKIPSSSSTLVLSDFHEINVEKIVEMGFDRQNVEKALKECLHDPDRTVEYLMSVSIYFILQIVILLFKIYVNYF